MGRFSVRPPPLGHPARPEAQPARLEAQPAIPEAQAARSEAKAARPQAQPASLASGPASHPQASSLAGWASGLAGWPRGGNGRTNEWTNGKSLHSTGLRIRDAALPPPMKTKEKVEQGKGTADHLMPLGYLLATKRHCTDRPTN